MAAEPTARDALIAEMLGDIGLLHDSVKSLKGVLPGQIAEVETKISGLIGLLMKAGDIYKTQIETYTDEQGEKIRVAMERDASTIKAKFERDSNEAIRAALAEVERTVKNTVQIEIAYPVQKVLNTQRNNVWRNMALCFTCGILGGALVLGVQVYTYDKNEAAFTDLGKSVMASWDKLDNKAKATIKAEREKK